MREIKFRAWAENEMSMPFGITEGAVFRGSSRIKLLSDLAGGNIIFMQYTGLKDKNGVDIYEGDIVRCVIGKSVSVFDIQWQKNKDMDFCVESWGWNQYGSDDQEPHQVWEVIGNIYENPELLERTEQ